MSNCQHRKPVLSCLFAFILILLSSASHADRRETCKVKISLPDQCTDIGFNSNAGVEENPFYMKNEEARCEGLELHLPGLPSFKNGKLDVDGLDWCNALKGIVEGSGWEAFRSILPSITAQLPGFG